MEKNKAQAHHTSTLGLLFSFEGWKKKTISYIYSQRGGSQKCRHVRKKSFVESESLPRLHKHHFPAHSYMRGAPNSSAGMCQPNIPALFRAPALMRMEIRKLLPKDPVVPTDGTGAIEQSHYSSGIIGSPPLLLLY